jgi:succinate dehydrogenase hydrophobic anchor subunit
MTALGVVLAVFVLWGLYVMKNRRVVRHFARRYERSVHKLMPPLTIGAAALSLCASVWSITEGALNIDSWHFWASVFGVTTSVLSLIYGCYCMFTVWRTIRTGRGKLGAVSKFVRDWYCSEHRSSLTDRDSTADFVTDALMESDFLEQMQRDRTRTKQRQQVTAAVELLDVDPDAVTWHEDSAFAAGGFSTVWRVTYCGEVVAAKVLTRPGAQSIRKAETWLHGVKKEAAILHRLSACDNIVNVLGIFERPNGAVLLMEYASGGTLSNHLHGASMDDASTFTRTSSSLANSAAGGTADARISVDGVASAAVDGSLPLLEQAEQLSILIDIAGGMLFCYTQDPPVQHR